MTALLVYTKNDSLYVEKRYANASAAKAAMTRTKKRDGSQKYPQSDYTVMTVDEFKAANVMVPTYNLLDPLKRVVMISKSEEGTFMDPATERYHSM